MKLKTCLNLFTALLAICIFLTCCQKGDAGPAGAAGATGANGAPGAAGPQGVKGDTGTANVIYSAWLDVIFKADTIHTGAVVDTVDFSGVITAPKLTAAIIDRGEIKVYFNWGTQATPDVSPLPISDFIFTPLILNPEFAVQKITLYSNLNPSTYTQAGLKYFQYRYILIPGGVPARMGQRPDLNNYKAVKDYYNLPD